MRAALVVLLVSSAAAWFAFMIIQGGATEHDGGGPHGPSPLLVAFAILAAMAGLILFASFGRRRGSVAKFK